MVPHQRVLPCCSCNGPRGSGLRQALNQSRSAKCGQCIAWRAWLQVFMQACDGVGDRAIPAAPCTLCGTHDTGLRGILHDDTSCDCRSIPCGAVAACTCWLSVFAIDTMYQRSHMQSSDCLALSARQPAHGACIFARRQFHSCRWTSWYVRPQEVPAHPLLSAHIPSMPDIVKAWPPWFVCRGAPVADMHSQRPNVGLDALQCSKQGAASFHHAFRICPLTVEGCRSCGP